jgi:hypothetical protein
LFRLSGFSRGLNPQENSFPRRLYPRCGVLRGKFYPGDEGRMSESEVRILTEPEYNQWDELVEQSRQGTIFHSSGWITTAAKVLHLDLVIIGVFNKTQLIGGCSLFLETTSGFYTKGTTELPLTPYGGFVIANQKSSSVREQESREHGIILLILEKIHTLNLCNIVLTNSPALTDIRPFTQNGWQESVHYCYIFPLTCTLEDHISKKIRWSLNKAKKSGIVVRQKWDKDLYWDLTLSTYRKQGKQPPYSRELLFSLFEIIQNKRCGEMWIAETASGKGAAAEIFIWDTHRAYRWLAASHTDYRDTEAPTLLLFGVMKYLQEKGCKKFNLMAANTPHLAKFISGFNPEFVPYYSVQKIRGMYRIPGVIRSLLTQG